MSFKTAWRRWRVEVHNVLEVGGEAYPMGRAVNAFLVILIIANGLAFAAETVNSVYARYGPAFEAFNTFSVMVFTVEYVLRVWSSVEIPLPQRLPHWRARLKFMLRPMMIIDLLAFLPWYLFQLMPVDLRALRILRLFRLLKLLRYSPALQTLQRVMANEYRALLGSLLVMMVLLLFAASIVYFLERDAQPDKFGSIPAAAWWALATLTTIGYGDIVPVTPLGKVFGSVVMLIGLGMFALPIAILSAGFSQESARHEFVVTWSMVARVPLFSTLDANEVGEVTKLLYTRLFQPGATIVSAGDAGAEMYLIGSGEATVRMSAGRKVRLGEGDFFGEMALLERRRHKHDVVADTICRVYVLDGEGLARLGRRHPEIVRHIEAVAMERQRENEKAVRAAKGPRKRSTAAKKAGGGEAG
ncbi:MAG: ion transporter [Methyloceanibacter sp.]